MKGPLAVSAPSAAERWSSIGLVTLVAIACYGFVLPWLGFYRDDWYQLWAGLTLGPRSIVTLFSIDRPIMGYTYAATFYFLRDSVLAWQVYALVLRWVGALGALWLFRKMWPARPLLTTSATLLFLVYPGFWQQPNANTFSNHLLSYAAMVLSLAATAEHLESPSGWRRTILLAFALASGAMCWLLYEYMIGLEAVRYYIIGRYAIRDTARPDRHWVARAARLSIPFIIPLLIFLTWRLFLFQADRGAVDVSQVVDQYGPNPWGVLIQRGARLLEDFAETAVVGWLVPARDRLAWIDLRAVSAMLLPAGLSVGALLVFARGRHWRLSDPAGEDPRTLPERELVVLGALATLAALAPVVATGRDVRWSSAFDRYTLHATLGVAMLTVGLIASTLRGRLRTGLVAALLGLSVITHYGNAAHWARFWEEQRRFWWELSWRAPAITPGTVLMANLPSQRYFEDYEVWGPANLIYFPQERTASLGAEVVAEDTAPKVLHGLKDVRWMRVLIAIPRDFQQVLIIDWPRRQACVHVLSGDLPESGLTSSALIQSLADHSQQDRIDPGGHPPDPPVAIFGTEPGRDWCWYYQTASLARQQGDWDRVAELADQARSAGYAPADQSEWTPFLQGYFNTGRWDQGRAIASSITVDTNLARDLCSRLNASHFVDQTTLQEARHALCGEPAANTRQPAPAGNP